MHTHIRSLPEEQSGFGIHVLFIDYNEYSLNLFEAMLYDRTLEILLKVRSYILLVICDIMIIIEHAII